MKIGPVNQSLSAAGVDVVADHARRIPVDRLVEDDPEDHPENAEDDDLPDLEARAAVHRSRSP
jgi:hypothetical protein